MRLDGPLRGPNHPFPGIPGGGLGLEGSGFRKLNLANKYESSLTLFNSRMSNGVFFDESGYELVGITDGGTDSPATGYGTLTYERKGISGWVIMVEQCPGIGTGELVYRSSISKMGCAYVMYKSTNFPRDCGFRS